MAKTKTFNFTHTTDEGEELTGTFTIKRISIADRTKIAQKKAQISGGTYTVRDMTTGQPTGQGIDSITDFFYQVLATLSVIVIQAPVWWKLDELTDDELLYKLYSEVLSYETQFSKRGGGTPAGNGNGGGGEETSNPEHQKQETPHGPKKVVGQQILDSLDL